MMFAALGTLTIPSTTNWKVVSPKSGSFPLPLQRQFSPQPQEKVMVDVNTDRANGALETATDLVQAGAVFNDAVRLLDGGLWSQPADNNNQLNYQSMVLADLNAVLNDVQAATTVNGQPLTSQDTQVLQTVYGQLQNMINEAQHAVGPIGTLAQNQLHENVTNILAEINNDANLATNLANGAFAGASTGVDQPGFQPLPVGADDAAALAKAAAGASLVDVGNVFNTAVDIAVGGLNVTNIGQFDQDMRSIETGLQSLLHNPTALAALETAGGETPGSADAALTEIHLQTAADQIGLQIHDYDHQILTNPTLAARGTNDNLLDIIDIVQGDAALNINAGGNGEAGNVGGFSDMPAFLDGTIQHFQDDQAQTNFWATFMAEANFLGTQLNAEAVSNSAADANTLITEIQNYEQFANAFDSQQGRVFEARFDNELKVISQNAGGTVLADSQAAINALNDIIKGTNVSNADNVLQAAATGFHDNAADVSGNNTPNGGSNFNADATTVAGATTPNGLAMGTIPVTSNPNVTHGIGAGASSGALATHSSGSHAGQQDAGPARLEPTVVAAHFDHLWHF
jgi:hypothetical protein